VLATTDVSADTSSMDAAALDALRAELTRLEAEEALV
jgi:hypothetical protein